MAGNNIFYNKNIIFNKEKIVRNSNILKMIKK